MTDDDDIQDYVRPWQSLTDDEVDEIYSGIAYEAVILFNYSVCMKPNSRRRIHD
jgi:hypothetical protein